MAEKFSNGIGSINVFLRFQPDIAACIKRTGELILNNGNVLRAIENLGVQKELAHRMRGHGKVHSAGSFIMFRYDGPSSMPPLLGSEISRDTDVIRCRHLEDVFRLLRSHSISMIANPPVPVSFVTRPTELLRFILAHHVSILPEEKVECTLEEELQIPMNRPSVKKLMETGKKPEKKNPLLEKYRGPF